MSQQARSQCRVNDVIEPGYTRRSHDNTDQIYRYRMSLTALASRRAHEMRDAGPVAKQGSARRLDSQRGHYKQDTDGEGIVAAA